MSQSGRNFLVTASRSGRRSSRVGPAGSSGRRSDHCVTWTEGTARTTCAPFPRHRRLHRFVIGETNVRRKCPAHHAHLRDARIALAAGGAGLALLFVPATGESSTAALSPVPHLPT